MRKFRFPSFSLTQTPPVKEKKTRRVGMQSGNLSARPPKYNKNKMNKLHGNDAPLLP